MRRCPGCGLGTERRDGCLHMACPDCSTHWCYFCRSVYDSGPDCYAHYCGHGSIDACRAARCTGHRVFTSDYEIELAERPLENEIRRKYGFGDVIDVPEPVLEPAFPNGNNWQARQVAAWDDDDDDIIWE